MILVFGLTGLMFAFLVFWYAWPDLCYTGDDEPDDLALTKRDTPSHVSDVWAGMAESEWRDDLPALGASIDRAIALAASLPDYSPTERIYLTPQGAALAASL